MASADFTHTAHLSVHTVSIMLLQCVFNAQLIQNRLLLAQLWASQQAYNECSHTHATALNIRHLTACVLCEEESGHSTIDQPERAPAAGLFASSPHSDSEGIFTDAVSGTSPPGSRSSSAPNATFHSAASAHGDSSPTRNSSGDASNSVRTSNEGAQPGVEEEGRRSLLRR